MSTISRSAWDNSVIVTRDGDVDSTWDGKVKTLVYNPVSMAWEAATQAGGGATGAADSTAANQVLGNASLASIDTKLTSQATAANQTSELAKLDTLITNTNKIPSAPAQEHTSAASPSSVRLSDGSAFISTLPVSIASMPSTPVTGIFWQATQPVSIASMPTTPVTGTFWQATQPVSGTVTVTPPTLTKGTQGATGFSTQDLKDAGRNQTNLFMALPIVTTTTDTLMSLTGYKAGAAVTATTTPAVVTSGKTYRITAITITYVAIATAGSVKVTLRANTGGVVAIGSPAVCSWVVGGPAAAAGVAQTVDVAIPDGLEFAAGTGIGISIQGLSTTQTAAAVGYGQVAINGFEY